MNTALLLNPWLQSIPQPWSTLFFSLWQFTVNVVIDQFAPQFIYRYVVLCRFTALSNGKLLVFFSRNSSMPLPVYLFLLLVLPVLVVGLTAYETFETETVTHVLNLDIIDILGLNATAEMVFPLHSSYSVGFIIC
jgi:hypothetical protein